MDELTRLRYVIETQRQIGAAGLGTEAVMQILGERARVITEADGAAVALVDGDEMVFHASSGLTGIVGARMEVGNSLSGRSLRLGVPMRCTDTEVDARVDRDICALLGIRSMVVVPLVHNDDPVGVLMVTSSKTGHFGETDVEILLEMTGFAAGPIAEPAATPSAPVDSGQLHDEVTGLAGRHLFVESLAQACRRADRNGTSVAAFLIHVEGYQRLSDRLGQAEGDEVLRLIAGRLVGSVRANDLVGRLSGGEFALLCEDAAGADTELITDRIGGAVRQVADQAPHYAGLGASVGVAWRNAEQRIAEELLTAADASLYRARKAAGHDD